MEQDSERQSVLQNSEISLRAPKTRVGKCRKLETKIRDSKMIGKRRRLKGKFAEYLEMEKAGSLISKEEDLRLERKLAKKLKVKNGKLGGNDELAMFLEGIPSVLDAVDGEGTLSKSLQDFSSREKEKLSKYALEETESQKESANMDGLTNSVDAGSEEYDNMEGLTLSKGTKRKKRKTKSEEYLEMEEMQEGIVSAAEALKSHRKLKKKVEVDEGKLCRDDDLNKICKGIPSVHDSLDDAESQDIRHNVDSSSGKSQKMKSAEQEQGTQTAIALLSGVSEPVKKNDHGTDEAVEKVPTAVPDPRPRSCMQNESEENAQVRKLVKRLLNKLSESNVESITREMLTIFQSLGRSVGTQIIGEMILAQVDEKVAATFAAFVAGMACLVGIDFGAKLLASLAKCFEMEYLEEDNLSLKNLTLLLSYLYTFGVCTSDLMYDFLIMLSKRLTEVDVSTILTILKSCGMKLRSEDPIGMKEFIHSVQQRVQELKASSGDEKSNMTSKRMEFMLNTICDIKNNKPTPKEGTVLHTRIKKWLQKLRVDNILIRGMKWSKLLDPNKKGQWWLSGDVASTAENIEEVAIKIDRGVSEAQKMLQLAAAQRMNTDFRRAIFCVIMTAEDCDDAFVKLLSLDLPGKQDREIMRVLMECCLQEKIFNKYYCILADKLCRHGKNHKFTLQYCVWDHFKELESMPLMRSMHLSKFVASMVASFGLSLAVLKVVDFVDPRQMTPKRIMHFKMLFEAIFEFSDKVVWNIFTRIAVTPEYESLRSGIKFFISKYVIRDQSSVASKFKIAKKALNNVEGILE